MVPRIPSTLQHAPTLQTALSLFLAASASACGSQFESETPDLPDGPVPVALAVVVSGLVFPLDLTAPAGDPRDGIDTPMVGAIGVDTVLVVGPPLSSACQLENSCLNCSSEPDTPEARASRTEAAISAEAALEFAKAGVAPIENSAPNAASAATTRRWRRLATKIPVLLLRDTPRRRCEPICEPEKIGSRAIILRLIGTPRRLDDCGLTGQLFNKQARHRH